MQNHNSILGVGIRSSVEEIKGAFRKAAKQWHPDKNPKNVSAEEKFKEIQDAYETLSNPCRRIGQDKFLQDDKLRQEQLKQQQGQHKKDGSWAFSFGVMLLIGLLLIMFFEDTGNQEV